MLFNTLSFAIFLPIIFILYWFAVNKSLKWQNILLLLSSYFFYACWDWKFLFLLIFSTLLDYYTGLKIADASNQKQKRIWLWLSIGINLGFLGIFKYYNFFATSFSDLFTQLGFVVNPFTIKVLLPVGISFYTFHGLSYVIDIYKERIKPERNFVNYSVFVSFFPLLVAGPIERATHLLPQILKKRTFVYEKAADGMRQILWGLFKKMVIADNCAEVANQIFQNPEQHNSVTLFLGAFFFTIQIYCDFSGYSDIALGTARLFGIELLRNFAFPYFSRDIAEFWRRWHISLSSWFKDYLYIPLGGSNGGKWMKVRNTFAIFLVSGFWHGANWTFLAWGFLNALYIMPSIVFDTNRNNLEIVAKGRMLPSIKEIISILITFMLTIFAWIFFRSESITKALLYIKQMIVNFNFSMPTANIKIVIWLFVAILFLIEWLQRENQFGLQKLPQNKIIRWGIYLFLIWSCFIFKSAPQEFIYFQF